MRILVTWGSKRGGTEGIGRVIASTLEERGFEVVATPVEQAPRLDGFDAVLAGSALYANRWTPSARRFVRRHVKALRRVPVWFFSSGPLDDSAERGDIAPTPEVAVLAERVGAKGHATFGGRLARDAKGFPAAAMAKQHAGDFRSDESIRAFAVAIAEELPRAEPGQAVEHAGHSFLRLMGHGVAGWLLCAGGVAALLSALSPAAALAVHAVMAPVIFAFLGWRYAQLRGSREPLFTAATWTLLVAGLDYAVVARGVLHNLAMFASFAGLWLPLGLIFVATWTAGSLARTLPWPKGDARRAAASASAKS